MVRGRRASLHNAHKVDHRNMPLHKLLTSPFKGLLLTLLLMAAAPPMARTAAAQTREQGPWWPNPTWGAEDQAGASNWITAEKVLEALSLATSGAVYEIGHPYERGMPLYGERSFTLYIPGSPTYEASAATAWSDTTSSCARSSARWGRSSTDPATSGSA